MVNDAFLFNDAFYFAMHFILIHLKLYWFKALFNLRLYSYPFQSFPTAFIHFFQILKTLSKL